MRKFNCSANYVGNAQSLEDADGWLLNEDMHALLDLQVGQTYVDSDGDTWERVE